MPSMAPKVMVCIGEKKAPLMTIAPLAIANRKGRMIGGLYGLCSFGSRNRRIRAASIVRKKKVYSAIPSKVSSARKVPNTMYTEARTVLRTSAGIGASLPALSASPSLEFSRLGRLNGFPSWPNHDGK